MFFRNKFEEIEDQIINSQIGKKVAQELNDAMEMAANVRDEIASISNKVDFLIDKDKQKTHLFEFVHFTTTCLLFFYVIVFN